jgi:putative DNA primase/helicase
MLTTSGGAGADRHPTEVMELRGKRRVTLSETGDDGLLREDFVKSLTGSDTLTGRWMRADFEQFQPTHKLQVVTNHLPRIRGTDWAIWRRVLVLEFAAIFGSAADVEAGRATAVGIPDLKERLKAEHEGILAWMVRGCMAWRDIGLAPPAAVLEAQQVYRAGQDRVALFVDEKCVVGPEHWCLLSDNSGENLSIYAAYAQWSKENGQHPVSREKLKAEILRVVKNASAGVHSPKRAKHGSTQRRLAALYGLAVA